MKDHLQCGDLRLRCICAAVCSIYVLCECLDFCLQRAIPDIDIIDSDEVSVVLDPCLLAFTKNCRIKGCVKVCEGLGCSCGAARVA